MDPFFPMKLQTINFAVLSVISGLIFPLWANAAVIDNQNAEQEFVDMTITTASNGESKKDGKQSLENEAVPRGKLLYENHCLSCHESLVHIRQDHKAKTYEDVQYWVGRWAVELDVKWSADEIDAVVQHLNDTFYHY